MQPVRTSVAWRLIVALLVLFFCAGYLNTREYFERSEGLYFILNILSLMSACGLLLLIRKVRPENIVVVLILFIFIFGYFYKFYFLAYAVANGDADKYLLSLFGLMQLQILPEEKIFDAFVVVAVAFMMFSSLASLHLLRQRRLQMMKSLPSKGKETLQPFCSRLVAVALILGVASAVLRYWFHLSTPDAVPLPFKLAAIISITNKYIAPTLLGIALLYAFRMRDDRAIYRMGAIYIGFALLQFVLFASKMDIIIPVVWFYLAMLTYDYQLSIDRKMLLLLGIGIMAVYPFISYYRVAVNISGGNLGSAEFLDALKDFLVIYGFDNVADIVLIGFHSIISRVVGFGELMIFMNTGANSHTLISYLFSSQSAGELLTESVGLEGTGVSASMLGQAYYATQSAIGVGLWVCTWAGLASYISHRLFRRASVNADWLWCLWIVNVLAWSIDELSLTKWVFLLVNVFAVLFIVRMLMPKTVMHPSNKSTSYSVMHRVGGR